MVSAIRSISLNPINANYMPPQASHRVNCRPGNNFNLASSPVTSLLEGGLVGYKYSGEVANISKEVAQAFKNGGAIDAGKGLLNGVKSFGGVALNGMGIGALIGGGISVVQNTYEVATGKDSGPHAIGQVISDTLGGATTGLGATAGGGTAVLALGAFGVAGTALTVAGVIGGMVGGTLAHKAFEGLGLRDYVQTKVSSFMNR